MSERWRTMSTVEMMCENLNVKHHVTEWEARCLKAEADRDALVLAAKYGLKEIHQCDGYCGGRCEYHVTKTILDRLTPGAK